MNMFELRKGHRLKNIIYFFKCNIVSCMLQANLQFFHKNKQIKKQNLFVKIKEVEGVYIAHDF